MQDQVDTPRNFPVLGVPEKKGTTLSGMAVGNFFALYVLTDRTPTGGKTRNMKILGHFGLGRQLALEEILGPGRKRKVAISRC